MDIKKLLKDMYFNVLNLFFIILLTGYHTLSSYEKKTYFGTVYKKYVK